VSLQFTVKWLDKTRISWVDCWSTSDKC